MKIHYMERDYLEPTGSRPENIIPRAKEGQLKASVG
jgi:hypothetical protein